MSLSYAPKVITDGLVFYYDQANTKKSWLGAPTTNLQTNPSTSNYGQYGPFVPALTQSDTVPTTYGTARNVLRVRCSTTDWGPCFYWLPPALTAGTTYTVSFYARTIDVASASMWFSNQNGSGDQNSLSHGHTITTQWQRYTYTQQLDIAKNVFYVWGTNGATLEFADFQIEASSWATPFVAGIRTNTQAILDLTGNNTITANSLTYNSDGNFSFNGSSNYMSCGPGLGISYTSFSVEASIKPTSNDGLYNNIISTTLGNNNDYEYGLTWDLGTYSSSSFNVQNLEISRAYGGFYNRDVMSSDFPFNTWVHLFLVVDSSANTYKIYANGNLDYTGTYSGTITHFDRISIGQRYYSGGYQGSSSFNGNIGKVSIYNRALTANEVQQNFQACRSRFGI